MSNSSQSQELLQKLINFCSQDHKHLQIIQISKEKYNIQHLALDLITPSSILQQLMKSDIKLDHVSTEVLSEKYQFKDDNWGHFQQKCFAWIVICYGFYSQKDLLHFNNEDISFIQYCFPMKQKQFLLYHIKVLIKGYINSKKQWKEAQSKLLFDIVRQRNSKAHWSSISYELFVRSHCQYFRKRDKCRQHWTNHLDPGLKKSEWSIQEDILLFESVVKLGKRWSQISKCFCGSRTQHMVKNRYNSILRKNKKVLGKKKYIDELLLEELKQIPITKAHQEKSISVAKEASQDQHEKAIETRQALPINTEIVKVPQLLDWNWASLHEDVPLDSPNIILKSIQFFNVPHFEQEQQDYFCLLN